MRARIKTFGKILLSPSVIVLAISLLLIILNLVVAHRIRPYNSDDVSWQNILFTWHPFSGEHVTLGGSDNFILKIPLFTLLGHFFTAGRKLLLLESSIFAITTFTLFYVSALYFLKKVRVKLTYLNLLPFLWLSSFGFAFTQLYLNPILRNFELGLSFIVFMLVAMIYYGDIKPMESIGSRLITLLATVITGLLIYNDPYFLYFTLGPIVLFSMVLFLFKKITNMQIIIVYICMFLSIIFSKLTALIAIKAGIKLVLAYPVEFVVYNKLFSNIALALHGLLVIFGADFFGRKVTSIVTFSTLINAFIVGFIVYQTSQLRHKAPDNKLKELGTQHLWTAFFGLMGVFVFIVYTMSTLAIDITTYRYFVMLVFSSVLFLAIIISSLKTYRLLLMALLLTAGIVLNIGVSISGHQAFVGTGITDNRGNAVNYDIIHAIENKGLTKGYANYWQGNINTYLSRNVVEFIPVYCASGRTAPFHFLIAESRFNRQASKSFYIIDPDLVSPPTCSPELLTRQFGEPEETFTVANKTILIFSYDILSKM